MKRIFKKRPKLSGELKAAGRFAYRIDMGKVRVTNEDQAIAMVNSKGVVLLAVCDGMGGQNKGELASGITISNLIDAFKSVRRFFCLADLVLWLNRLIRNINTFVNNESNRNALYQGMGTTLSLAIIYKKKLITAQIGDSRIYELKDNKLNQISVDQTYVGYLYRTGQITKEEMKTHPSRHAITNAIGVFPSIEIDLKIKNYNDESLLLCSDGLYNNVSENSIASVLKGSDAPEQKVSELISMANGNGGSDNIAVVIWERN